MEIGAVDNPKISKTILHSGREYKPIHDGTRVYFHFVTKKCDENQVVIDDSRKMGKPMELVIGKKFKMEVWETVVRAMAIGEVSSFKVDKSLVYSYPVISKTLREANSPKGVQRNHVCAHTLHTQGIGYEDLDDLLKSPADLEFIIELLKVETAGEYERQSWQLSESDRLEAVPKLKEEGNSLFREGLPEEAAAKYSTAIGYLDQFMLCEKPGDVEWTKLNEVKLSILLNFAQCKLTLKDYYQVIEHCSTVLQYQSDNVKALYRRGRAHAFVWDVEAAKSDLELAATLDPSLGPTVKELLTRLEAALKEQDACLRDNIKGKLF